MAEAVSWLLRRSSTTTGAAGCRQLARRRPGGSCETWPSERGKCGRSAESVSIKDPGSLALGGALTRLHIVRRTRAGRAFAGEACHKPFTVPLPGCAHLDTFEVQAGEAVSVDSAVRFTDGTHLRACAAVKAATPQMPCCVGYLSGFEARLARSGRTSAAMRLMLPLCASRGSSGVRAERAGRRLPCHDDSSSGWGV
jgi:hypothetical protein